MENTEVQGTKPGTAGWLSQTIGTIGNVAGSYFGAQAAPAQTTVYAAPAESSSNKTIYIVIGAVVLMLIVFLIVKNKK